MTTAGVDSAAPTTRALVWSSGMRDRRTNGAEDMSGRRSPEALRAELDEVGARISAHPLASPRIRAAHDVVGAVGSRDAAKADQELADQGLPSVAELGRAHVAGLWSWWRLHRRKRKLERAVRESER
jgi:hypothetical protein